MRRSEILTTIACVVAILFLGATSFMSPRIYSSPLWIVSGVIIISATIAGIVKARLWRQPALAVMHLAFILIIAGGITTGTTAIRGTLHLHPHETADSFILNNRNTAPLPVKLRLDTFYTDYYPGMTLPCGFNTIVTTSGNEKLHIAMNRIGKIGSYRLYQTSFDSAGGSILSVSHDPAGIAVTYTGYAVFAIAGLLWLIGARKPGFRKLAVAAAIMMAPEAADAAPAVSTGVADSIAPRQVIFNGRIVPFSTLAYEFTRKITGSTSVGGMKPEQFVASLIVYNRQWRDVPFIRVKSKQLRNALEMTDEYIAPAALYDGSGYRPATLYKAGTGKLDNEIVRLDEKIALLASLWSGTLFTPLPAPDIRTRSDASIKAEIAYNRLQPLRLYFITAVAAAALTVILSLTQRRLWIRATALVTTLTGVSQYAWLWYITGSIPLWQASGIMQFMSAGLSCAALCLSFRKNDSMLLTAMTLLMAALTALVALLSTADPSITPMMPVLSSPWLAIHVSLVMTAYVLLGLTLPVSLLAVCQRTQRQRLTALSLEIVRPGVYILGLGIITGAMWANVSWGRYWAWDPKETWALVTMLLYALPLHGRTGLSRNQLTYNIYIAVAFLSVIMTYAGVNFLPSLHAYQ